MLKTISTVVISFTICVIVGFYLLTGSLPRVVAELLGVIWRPVEAGLIAVLTVLLHFLERTDWYAVGTFVGLTIRYALPIAAVLFAILAIGYVAQKISGATRQQ